MAAMDRLIAVILPAILQVGGQMMTLTGESSDPGQVCQGVPVSCDKIPSEIPYGRVTKIKDMENQGALEFSCDEGFVLAGQPVLTCCDGYWQYPFPKCFARDCKTHLQLGNASNGTYIISPDGKSKLVVHCDMSTEGGGWTVIQRRIDGATNFFRKWIDYKEGFGQYNHNFWIGLDNIHELTKQDSELFIYMEAGHKESRYAQYKTFQVADESDKYRLHLEGYTGSAGNCNEGGGILNNMQFSTIDNDNDKQSCCNCASKYKGGWWYNNCHRCNPNGLYLNGSHPKVFAAGINWQSFKGYYYSMTYMEMKIRRK